MSTITVYNLYFPCILQEKEFIKYNNKQNQNAHKTMQFSNYNNITVNSPDLWMFRPMPFRPLPGRFASGTFHSWTFRPLDDLPPGRFAHARGRFAPGCFAPWTFRSIYVDVSPPELSVLGISPCRCERTDGRFDVKPLALASSSLSPWPWPQWSSLWPQRPK